MAALSLLYPGSLVQLLSRQTTARIFSCPRYLNCHLTLHNSSVYSALVPRSFTPPSTYVRKHMLLVHLASACLLASPAWSPPLVSTRAFLLRLLLFACLFVYIFTYLFILFYVFPPLYYLLLFFLFYDTFKSIRLSLALGKR